jgi:hypothetical protein
VSTAKQSASTPRRRGRPSSYTPAVASQIIRFFEEGGTRHGLDAEKSLPSWPTFKRWMAKFPELRSRYVRAQKDKSHAMIDRALDVANSVTEDNAKAARVQIDAYLRIAEKLNPKAYGNKLSTEHSGPDGGIIPVGTIDISKDEAVAAYMRLIKG